MIERLEQYATQFFDLPMIAKMLSYAPIMTEFSKDHPLEAAVILICFVIIILMLLSHLLYRGSSDQAENAISKPSSLSKLPKELERKLERLAHPTLPLYEVAITDDMIDLISENANQQDSAHENTHMNAQENTFDTAGLSTSARAMLEQLRRDGKIT